MTRPTSIAGFGPNWIWTWLGRRVDARDAERVREDAQAVALDKRLRRLGQRAEAVDQLLVHGGQRVLGVAVREALVEHEPLVHVGAVARPAAGRGRAG